MAQHHVTELAILLLHWSCQCQISVTNIKFKLTSKEVNIAMHGNYKTRWMKDHRLESFVRHGL